MLKIEKAGFAEQTINKSKFLAWAVAGRSEQEVATFLSAISRQHSTASHLAYAFRLTMPQTILSRYSDAGEPSGTAGKPISQMLEGRNLMNVCVAVIRYYGGVNLGKGGLARAYGGTARIALEAAEIAVYVEMQECQLTIAYNRLEELSKVVAQLKGKVIENFFEEAVHVKISLPAIERQALISRFSAYHAN
ncbi:MAG: IMPACT family protein [Methylophilaceae bacterium]